MESSLACLNVFYLSSLIRPYVDTHNKALDRSRYNEPKLAGQASPILSLLDQMQNSSGGSVNAAVELNRIAF